MKISYLVGQDLTTMRLNADLIAKFLGCDTWFEACYQNARMGDHMLYMCETLPQSRSVGSAVYELGALKDHIVSHPEYAARWKDPLKSIQIINTVDPEVYDALSEMFATEIGGNIAAEMKSIAEECDGSGYERPDPSEDLSPPETARLRQTEAQKTVLEEKIRSIKGARFVFRASIKPNDAFEEGDLVQLNSGSPDLTILMVTEDESALCCWIDCSGNYHEQTFPTECLTPVARQAPCAGDVL